MGRSYKHGCMRVQHIDWSLVNYVIREHKNVTFISCIPFRCDSIFLHLDLYIPPTYFSVCLFADITPMKQDIPDRPPGIREEIACL
jgi:hypothetical protein